MNTTLDKAFMWIDNNTLENGGGITVTHRQRRIYPEVTGYYIPTLLQFGKKERALSYAKHMCKIQKENGSWYDPRDIEPYVFDTCQILKGLVAICKEYPEIEEFKEHLKKGCNWVLSQMDEDGRLRPCRENTFSDMRGYSELIHIYCLSPLNEADEVLKTGNKYSEAAQKCLRYYVQNFKREILDFHLLAHFYAYIIEGLVDMGEVELAKQAMDNISTYQRSNGMIPAFYNVEWTCSTALFQFAITWFKLGEKEKGHKTFMYGCTLQNESGGWFGRYPINKKEQIIDDLIRKSRIPFLINRHQPNYFPEDEISWAVKFYLDALWLDERK